MTWINRWTPGWIGTLGAMAVGAPVQVVIATDYLSVEDAQKALFPQADRFPGSWRRPTGAARR